MAMYSYVTELKYYRAKTDSIITHYVNLTCNTKLKQDEIDDLYVYYNKFYGDLFPNFKLFEIGFPKMVKK